MKKKFLCLALALAMLLGLVACGGNDNTPADTDTPANTDTDTPANTDTPAEPGEFQPMTYDYEALYNDNLGEFYSIYMDAKDALNPSERWAKMAIAEAKLLETGAVSLTRSRGGNYAMSRVAGKTQSGVLFGNDSDRTHQTVVANELIKRDDQLALRAKWAELAGTGTFLQWAKDYLVEQGYTLRDTFGYTYSTDPTTWDIMATSQQTDTEPVIQTYDGLLEYDCENVQQPALAESMEVSPDGLTYTFKIREGQIWVDSQGRKVADVKADDWVAGMQHMLDAKGGLQTLVFGIVAGAMEYATGETTDFDTVGVKAPDDHTLVYTLEAPCAYFNTMLGYSIFAPVSRDYYTSQGGKFGQEYDPSASSYNYGKTPNNIAYNGPYLVTSYTDHNSIVYKANESYWNPDNVTCKNLVWYYNDGSDPTKAYEDAKSGLINGAGLTTNVLELAKSETCDVTDAEGNAMTYFDAYQYNSATDATTFMGFYNLARLAYTNYNDDSKMVSTQTHDSADAIDVDGEVYTTDIEDDAARTHVAVSNQNFRLALTFAFDRGAYNAAQYGEDLKYISLLNTIVPGNFVTLQEEVTVDINGTPTTFPANTNYGEIVQAQLDADGIQAKVWDEAEASSQGFDGWFNVDVAKSYMDKAVAELAAQGVEVSAENPIQIDYAYGDYYEPFVNQANVYQQCIQNAFGGLVQVNLVGGDSDALSDATYQPDNGSEMNYDLSHQTGWGPDYGDPATWLDCFLPYGDGYMTTSLGLWHN